MTIELNEYGLMLDLGDFIYLSLSWAFLILSALVFIAYKALKAYKRNRVVSYPDETCTNSKWGFDE